MGRTRRVPFPVWQTCKNDGIEKRYIRLGNSQLLHVAMTSLSDKAFRIYVHMLLEAGGDRCFVFPRSVYKKIASNDGFSHAKAELIQKGFIKVKQNNANLRKANIYEFSEEWKQNTLN